MEPFNENADEEIQNKPFWDFYFIGGRWSGTKLLAQYDKAKIDEFYAWMASEKVTVSGLTCGKEELKPATQIPKVDAKWNELFPSDKPTACPLFNHYHSQYKHNLSDVCKLGELPELSCERVIFGGNGHGKLEATFMITDDFYNGVNYVKSNWDGTVKQALEMFQEKLKGYRKEYAETITPQNDWLVVTVDYHS